VTFLCITDCPVAKMRLRYPFMIKNVSASDIVNLSH
jgi:hypothetical protein